MARKLSNHFADGHFNQKNETLNIQSNYIVSKFLFDHSILKQVTNNAGKILFMAIALVVYMYT